MKEKWSWEEHIWLGDKVYLWERQSVIFVSLGVMCCFVWQTEKLQNSIVLKWPWGWYSLFNHSRHRMVLRVHSLGTLKSSWLGFLVRFVASGGHKQCENPTQCLISINSVRKFSTPLWKISSVNIGCVSPACLALC